MGDGNGFVTLRLGSAVNDAGAIKYIKDARLPVKRDPNEDSYIRKSDKRIWVVGSCLTVDLVNVRQPVVEFESIRQETSIIVCNT